MRALILHSGNLYGGIETALVSLAETANRYCGSAAAPGGTSDLELSVALCFDDGRVAKELRASGTPVYALGAARMSRPWQVWQARRRLAALLASTRVDVCVTPSTWTHALFAPVVRKHGLPLAVWAHDRWTPDRSLDRLALRYRPDSIVANSKYTAEGMSRVWPDVPVRVVHCPVRLSHASAANRDAVRAELGTPPDALVIVQVGRLDPYKGHRTLIQALTQLPATLPWHCWVVGGADGAVQNEYLEQLKTLAATAGLGGRVNFTGARSDVTRVLSAADIFCHPNVSPEPFGLVFIEALRAGLPVVGTATGGVPEIVTEECGRLVAPGDVNALATVLTELLQSATLRQQLGKAGPARATLLCDPGPRVEELARALASITPGASERTSYVEVSASLV